MRRGMISYRPFFVVTYYRVSQLNKPESLPPQSTVIGGRRKGGGRGKSLAGWYVCPRPRKSPPGKQPKNPMEARCYNPGGNKRRGPFVNNSNLPGRPGECNGAQVHTVARGCSFGLGYMQIPERPLGGCGKLGIPRSRERRGRGGGVWSGGGPSSHKMGGVGLTLRISPFGYSTSDTR